METKSSILWAQNPLKEQGYTLKSLFTQMQISPWSSVYSGFEEEFVRINKTNPKLNITFFVKSTRYRGGMDDSRASEKGANTSG
jgi:hypothetical protein